MGPARRGACAFLLAAAPAVAAAQQRSGSLQVLARDAAGAPLPGLTITATIDSGTGARECVTGPDGACVILALAPGRYLVAVSSATPSPAIGPESPDRPVPAVGAVIVELAPGDHLAVRLGPEGTAGGRSVTALESAPQAEAALGRDELHDLATRRRLLDALRAGPLPTGTSPAWVVAGRLGIRTFLEGAGDERHDLHGDVLEALRVEAEGAGADSARGTAGAISAVLRAGGRRVSGEVAVAFEGSALDGRPRPFSRYSPWDSSLAERGLTIPATPWAAIAPSASIGGPAGRPGLTFHASGSYSRRDRRRDVIFIDDPDRTRRRFSWFSWSAEGAANLTAAARTGRRLRLSAVLGRGRSRGSAPALEPDQGVLPDGSSTAGLTRAPFEGAEAAAARWGRTGADTERVTLSSALDWPLGGSASLSADAALSHASAWTPPTFRSNEIRHVFATSNLKVPGIPPADAHPAGYADHPTSYGAARDAPDRALLDARVEWSPGRRRSHLFSAGLRAERLADDVYVGHVRPIIELHWNRSYTTAAGERVTGRYGYYTVSRPGTIGQATGATVAAWWQDRWSPHDRFTADVGMRVEREAAPSYRRGPGVLPVVFGFGQKIAPRLAVAWRPDEEGRWRADASFGLFYDWLALPLARALLGARRDVAEAWTLDTLDWRHLVCDEGARTCPGRFVERVDAQPPWNVASPALAPWLGPSTRIDPDLQPMRTAEWAAGIERRLGRHSSLGLRYTGKRLARALEDVGLLLPGLGETLVLANPGFGYGRRVAPAWPGFPMPRAERRYDELEVELRRRGRPVALTARYRWSRLVGNYGGLSPGDEGGRESTNTTSAFDLLYSSYDRLGRAVSGRLPGDRPHSLAADATIVLPFGTTVSLAGTIESGRPESSEVVFRGARVRFNGLGDLGRQPACSQLDLQLRQGLRIAGRLLVVEATVSNLLDQATPTGFFSTNPYRDDLTAPEAAFFAPPWDPAEWARRMRAAGETVRDEQLYLVADRFQRPRRITLEASLRF